MNMNEKDIIKHQIFLLQFLNLEILGSVFNFDSLFYFPMKTDHTTKPQKKFCQLFL